MLWVRAQQPVTDDNCFNRALTKQSKNDFDGAIEDYTKAIQLNPQAALAFYDRGLAHHHHGDFARALADETKAIELRPDLADAYYDRGTIRILNGDYAGGRADHSKAVALNATSFRHGTQEAQKTLIIGESIATAGMTSMELSRILPRQLCSTPQMPGSTTTGELFVLTKEI